MNGLWIALPIGLMLLGKAKTTMKTNNTQYDALIKNYSSKYNLPFDLVKAIIRKESSFNPNAVAKNDKNKDGDYDDKGEEYSRGLMQINQNKAKDYGIKDFSTLFSPNVNIELGCKILAKDMKRYNGNINHVIAAYNAGSMFTNNNGQYINQEYVDKVNEFRKDYV